jgi:hypothetical protein
MTTYKNDPRRITTRFNSNCSKCNGKITKGETAFYWPNGKKVMCTECGKPEYRQFLSNAADEDVFYGIGNPY